MGIDGSASVCPRFAESPWCALRSVRIGLRRRALARKEPAQPIAGHAAPESTHVATHENARRPSLRALLEIVKTREPEVLSKRDALLRESGSHPEGDQIVEAQRRVNRRVRLRDAARGIQPEPAARLTGEAPVGARLRGNAVPIPRRPAPGGSPPANAMERAPAS